jgi:hypothetical protein
VNKVAELLETAADRIENHGWVQGQLIDLAGRTCARGAIILVRSDDTTNATYHEYDKALRTLAQQVFPEHNVDPWPGALIERWNDSEGMTKEEVIHQMHLAAKVASEDDSC